ncbi:EamA family transporter [Qingrenia yutianensis]|uniref:EamA family transporter n=1 Tax=Qingrenia yutianensis TaxID=2763676 RepID=A0A926FAW5_9FIRM|nr:EamA family transporter [Qingrenia yutianensis]
MWLAFAVLSAFFAGITAVLSKVVIKNVNSNLGTAIRTVIVFIFSWIMVFVAGAQNGVFTMGTKTPVFLILSGFATGASWLCYYKALQDGPASVVVPIDKLSILATVSFSYVVLKEKLTKKSFTGLILLICGTLLLLV